VSFKFAMIQLLSGSAGIGILAWKFGWWIPIAIFLLLFSEHIWLSGEIKKQCAAAIAGRKP